MSDSAAMKSAGATGLPAIGSLIAGRYRIERVVGQGGMGVVYAARHVQLNELVAVKMLHPKVAKDEQSKERFLREARACVKIKNEHVVKVIDVFTGEGSVPPYMLMEFLVGEDLGIFVRGNGPMQITMAVDFLLQAAEAIAEAHSYGIVHRDIKPANLLLTQRSDGMPLVKVLDFGISKAVGADEEAQNQNLTATAAVFGSPTYMSPEQVRSSKHVDQRADVWSLGIVLFEMLTARVPFGGESMSGLLASIVADAPRGLREFRPDLPESLQLVIAACLEKNRDRRIQSVAELATLLKPFASPAGIQSIDTIARLATVRNAASMRPPMYSQTSAASSSPVMAFGATERSVVTNAPVTNKRNNMAVVAIVAIGMLVVGGVGVAGFLKYRPGARIVAANATNGINATSTPVTASLAPPTSVVAPVIAGSASADPGVPPQPLASASASAKAPVQSGGATVTSGDQHHPHQGVSSSPHLAHSASPLATSNAAPPPSPPASAAPSSSVYVSPLDGRY